MGGGEAKIRKLFEKVKALLQIKTRTHSMAGHRKSPRSRRNLMVIKGHQFDRR